MWCNPRLTPKAGVLSDDKQHVVDKKHGLCTHINIEKYFSGVQAYCPRGGLEFGLDFWLGQKPLATQGC